MKWEQLATKYALQSGEYSGLLQHISLGIKEKFITSLDKIEQLIDIRLKKNGDDLKGYKK